MAAFSQRISRIGRAVASLTGWRRAALAVFAGSASVLAFAPFFASPILFLTLPIFIWLIDGSANPKAAARDGWWFGFGYFFFNLVWLGEAFLVEADKFAWLLPFAITLLPAAIALFWAWAAAVMRRFWMSGFARVVLFAIILSIAEWLRGHIFTGLPWNVPGYALTAPVELMQGAGVFGIYGLTLIALVVFAGPLVILGATRAGDRPAWRSALALAVLPIAALWGYGAAVLTAPLSFMDGVMLRVVQPSVLQTEKWRPEHQRRIFDDHLALSKTNARGETDNFDGITHVVWPEAAMPFFPLEAPKALEEIAAVLPDGSMLLTGALRRELPPDSSNQSPGTIAAKAKVFNSILALDQDAKLVSIYDKIHLVPFGEYLPAEKMLTAFGLKKLTHGLGAFTPGRTPREPMAVPGLPPVTGLICYEALFPNEVVQTESRPGVILNVTNDGWFGNSTGPRQHFHQSRVRAVEQGVPLIRAANNGISAVVDPYGRLLGELGMNVRGVIDSRLPERAPLTPYARFGDLVFLAMLAAAGLLAFGLKVGRHR
ncbi:MAG TPA: apolipoprotein N-acyltransferase [Hyphomicrobium sp.]|nr:apolipoprotein N-acyltransferase [Hyphomicrobium sp.]